MLSGYELWSLRGNLSLSCSIWTSPKTYRHHRLPAPKVLSPQSTSPKSIVTTVNQPQKYCHRSLPAPKVLSLQWTSPKSIVSIIYQPRKYYYHDVPVLLPLLSDFSVCEVVQVTSACRREGIVFSRSETLARRSVHVWGKSVCCYGVFAVRSTVWSRIRVGSSAQSAAKVSQGKLNNSGHLANGNIL